jgi:hypothetical protein
MPAGRGTRRLCRARFASGRERWNFLIRLDQGTGIADKPGRFQRLRGPVRASQTGERST